MASLVLRFAGPIQSYAGYRLRLNSYPVATAPVPSKSAVAGLLGAALGRRDLDILIDDITLHVRVDKTNAPAEDLQVLVPLPAHVRDAADRAERVRQADPKATAQHAKRTGAAAKGGKPGTALVNRDFIPHAEFICALSHPDPDTVTTWLKAFQAPTYMTFLGRRANPPTFPFILGTSTEPDPVTTLTAIPRVPRNSEIPWGQTAADTRVPVRLYEITGTHARHQHNLITHLTPTSTTREEQIQWLSTHLNR